jgi:hypothetical protein
VSVPREIRFDGVRVRYDSPKGYDELLAALLADIGEKPVQINDFATATDDWQSYQDKVEPHVGPSGFMLFNLIDHGAWITSGRTTFRPVIPFVRPIEPEMPPARTPR